MRRDFIQTFRPYDLAAIAFSIISGILVLTGAFRIESPDIFITIRLALIASIVALAIFTKNTKQKSLILLRNFYPVLLWIYFFRENNYINNMFFPDLDKVLHDLETTIFKEIPGVWLTDHIHFGWLVDLMALLYFGFYFLLGYFLIKIYRSDKENFDYTMFILSMVLYVIFIISVIAPVAGPQYYLIPPENKIPDGIVFRDVYYWFMLHTDMPSASFPSISAVVICILLYLSYIFKRNFFKYCLILGILVILASIYLKIHYTTDVIIAILAFPALYWISSRTYTWLTGLMHSIK